MLFIPQLRERRIASAVRTRFEFYSTISAPSDRRDWQLKALNFEWARVTKEVPYYKELHRTGKLPDVFSSLAEFAGMVPATDRRAVQTNGARMASPGRPDFFRKTGGSTAEPIQLPAWKSEYDQTRPDTWVGRQRYDVRPSAKQYMIWGHSHLWGRGLEGRLTSLNRQLRDRALGYYRFPAYDLSATALRRAACEMVRFRPDYVLGYSVALDRFARANQSLANELRALELKVVVAAAECFPSDDSENSLRALFGCPVAMEYGSVECGLVAHTLPAGGYEVFWHSYLVQIDPQPSPSGGHGIYITSLYPRCFPLVRYQLGDEIERYDKSESIYSFARVLGRCNAFLRLDDGTIVHSEAFTHAVRGLPNVLGYQIVNGNEPVLNVVLRDDLGYETQQVLRHNLGQIHQSLRNMPIAPVDRLIRTVAGKTPLIVNPS